MGRMKARPAPFALFVLAAAAALPVRASDTHNVAPPAPKTPPPVAVQDPMDRLRERLAEKLGAVKAPQATSPNVLRVTARGSEAVPASGTAPAAPARAPRPAPKRPAPPGHWDYDGAHGPAHWATLKPEFAACAKGERQSPIDIKDGLRLQLDPVRFDYKPSAFRVVDTGHTVQANIAAGNTIEVMGRRYELQQFHFHRPSEERIDGRVYDMDVHLVHKDPEGRLAVVAVLLESGSALPVVQAVWNNLPLEKGEELAARVPIDPAALLPAERGYYTYMGSLTTPPCSEGVVWMVMKQAVTISPEQIGVFTRLYPMNARPVQAASGRMIKESE
jgi:carbonic anhydrase